MVHIEPMLNRSSNPKRDLNQTAYATMLQATGQKAAESAPPRAPEPTKPEKNPAAVALGRLGGLKGGKARAAKMSPEKRSEIAKKAASARWDKKYG
jgi:hypothetical protein